MMATVFRPTSEAEFRQRIEDARLRFNITDVIGRWTALKRSGREMKGLCLFHQEHTPSMMVNDVKGQFFCQGCGAHGDIFSVIMEKDGLTFIEALSRLEEGDLPTVDPAERIRQRRREEADRKRDIADAREFWARCVDPAGTPAETYVRDVRRLRMPVPGSIRFGNLPAWRDKKTGEWGKALPAMVCAAQSIDGRVVGIQRIFLRDGGRAKANMKKPKLSLGSVRGAALRLGPVRSEIIICEGPEDGLSLAQELPDQSVWATLGTGLMPAVEFPDTVTSVIIAGQNDDPGRAAVVKASEALLARHFSVRTMFPDAAYKDWNDQLRGIRR